MIMFSIDSKRRLADWNEEAEHRLGFVRQEVIGELFLEFILYPFRELVDNMMNMARNGVVSEPVRMPFFTQVGDTVDVSLSVKPCNKNATFVGSLSLECTLAKDTTVPPREVDVNGDVNGDDLPAQNLYDSGEMASPSALIVVDEHGRITKWNEQAEELTLFLYDEVKGLQFRDFIAWTFRKAVGEVIRQVARARAVRHLHLPYYTDAGERLDVLLKARACARHVVLEGHLVELSSDEEY
eukprot:TRINITY_DN8047_c0_g1_i1.p1 TRINITY_DN8047_c0_g1~~TRINITY_DN8047_c0_g1_i1.p1  ORF type:complete len:240 (+),score=41.28 TRINITY_DN8047_c0_g1_i1:64-783(+)